MVDIGAQEAVVVLRDFLCVFVHMVLALRSVCPSDLFDDVQWHSFKVRKCRDPRMQQYVNDVLDQVQPYLAKGLLAQLVVVIVDLATEQPVERWGVDINSHWLTQPNARASQEALIMGLSRLLVKMHMVDGLMQDRSTLPTTFTVLAHVDGLPPSEAMAEQERQHWVEVDNEQELARMPPQASTVQIQKTVASPHFSNGM